MPGRSRRAASYVGQVLARADDREPAVRARGHRVGTGRHVEGARQEPPPRRRRPAEREREQDHVVAAIVVAVEVEVARRLGRRGQDLERHVALDQPRNVDVPARRALQQVAAPQQRIGVEVGHPYLGVQRAGAVGRAVRRPFASRAQARLGAADHRPAADARRRGRDDAGGDCGCTNRRGSPDAAHVGPRSRTSTSSPHLCSPVVRKP